jgi:hypothetical protein
MAKRKVNESQQDVVPSQQKKPRIRTRLPVSCEKLNLQKGSQIIVYIVLEDVEEEEDASKDTAYECVATIKETVQEGAKYRCVLTYERWPGQDFPTLFYNDMFLLDQSSTIIYPWRHFDEYGKHGEGGEINWWPEVNLEKVTSQFSEEELNALSRGSTLEIGCGMNPFCAALARPPYNFQNIVCSETVDDMVSELKKKFQIENVEFVQLDADWMTGEYGMEGKHNLVVEKAVLDSLGQKQIIRSQILRETSRILVEGGFFVSITSKNAKDFKVDLPEELRYQKSAKVSHGSDSGNNTTATYIHIATKVETMLNVTPL